MKNRIDNIPVEKRPRGRPKGIVPSHTLLLQRQKAVFNQRASRMAGKLLDAQAVIALGTHHMVVKSIVEGKVHLNIVRDDKRQQELLDTGIYGQDYLIIEGTPGDWRAADAILNRAWGKPKETLELEGDVKFSLKALHLHKNETAYLPVPAEVISISTPPVPAAESPASQVSLP